MRSVVGQWWRQAAVAALLLGLDAAISLPIMGATYRPFSWMSIAPADAATLYPVIQDLRCDAGGATVSVEVAPGAHCVLQRSTNLLDAAGWTDVATLTATNQRLHLIDTNPVTRAVFYRVKQILGGTP